MACSLECKCKAAREAFNGVKVCFVVRSRLPKNNVWDSIANIVVIYTSDYTEIAEPIA